MADDVESSLLDIDFPNTITGETELISKDKLGLSLINFSTTWLAINLACAYGWLSVLVNRVSFSSKVSVKLLVPAGNGKLVFQAATEAIKTTFSIPGVLLITSKKFSVPFIVGSNSCFFAS